MRPFNKKFMYVLLVSLLCMCGAHIAIAGPWTDKTEKTSIVDADLLLLGDSEATASGYPINKTLTYETLTGPIVLRGTNVLTDGNLPKATSDGQTLEDSFVSQVSTGDDAGIVISGGQLSVGAPGAGQEMVVGEGDSYPVVGAWHFDIANLTNQTITSATDVTTILQSDDLSTTGLFGGTATGNCILAYSDSATYGGVKAKIDTAGTVEPANIEARYLSATNTWTTATFMASDADDLEQYGNVLAARDDSAEQWRFGFNPLVLPVPWDELTMTINGSDYTGYFARFCTIDVITLDPIIQQIKLHTNRVEFNNNGRSEYFGIARYPKTIDVNARVNSDKSPGNKNIAIASGFTITGVANEFKDNSEDGFILSGAIPEGMDTSVPVMAIIDWYADTTNAGDVELQLELVGADVDFLFDGNNTAVAAVPVISTIGASSRYEIQRSTFLVNNSGGLPQQAIYGSLFRDARVGNTEDTLAGSIVIVDWKVVGYFWKP